MPAVVRPVAPAVVGVVPAAVVFQPLVVLAAVVVVVPAAVPLSSLSAFARRRLTTPAGVFVATSRPFSSIVWGPRLAFHAADYHVGCIVRIVAVPCMPSMLIATHPRSLVLHQQPILHYLRNTAKRGGHQEAYLGQPQLRGNS